MDQLIVRLRRRSVNADRRMCSSSNVVRLKYYITGNFIAEQITQRVSGSTLAVLSVRGHVTRITHGRVVAGRT